MNSKKLKKMIAGIVAGAMVLTMFAGTAFAADEQLPDGTPENPATVAITKKLQMPEGTTTPTATFNFIIDKVSMDEDDSDLAKDEMPTLSGSTAITTSMNGSLSGDVKTVTMNTGNILLNKTWPNAGEYVYKVTEAGAGSPGAYTIVDANKETLVYSQAEYELHIYIAEDEQGVLYVKSAAAIIKKNNDGTTGSGSKIDPTAPSTTATGNNFAFTNTYTHTKGGGETPNPTRQSIGISKTVEGELGSKAKYFLFDITIANNSLVSIPTYKAYICTLSGSTYTKVSAAEANNQYDNTKDYITVTAGLPKEIALKHGQYLVFMDMPIGTYYTANEQGASGYVPTVHIVANGVAVTPDLTSLKSQPLTTQPRLVGEGDNSADFTNEYAATVPTGILLNSLPIIMLVLAAIGAFGIFVAKRRRRITQA